jgi:hypothetical protein
VSSLFLGTQQAHVMDVILYAASTRPGVFVGCISNRVLSLRITIPMNYTLFFPAWSSVTHGPPSWRRRWPGRFSGGSIGIHDPARMNDCRKAARTSTDGGRPISMTFGKPQLGVPYLATALRRVTQWRSDKTFTARFGRFSSPFP